MKFKVGDCLTRITPSEIIMVIIDIDIELGRYIIDVIYPRFVRTFLDIEKADTVLMLIEEENLVYEF